MMRTGETPGAAQISRAGLTATMAVSDWDRAIGRRILRLREARGWTMEQLAERCPGGAASASQINKLEKGYQQFTAQWLYRLAEALEHSVCELMEDWPVREHVLVGRIRELSERDQQAIEHLVDRFSQASPGTRHGEPEE